MDDRSEALPENAHFVLSVIHLDPGHLHRVDHQTESDEEGVLREEQDDEDTAHVSVSEFIDHEVKDDDSLKDK